MRHLTLVKSHEKNEPDSEIVPEQSEIDPTAQHFLDCFDACVDAIKDQNISFNSFAISSIEGQKSVQAVLEGLDDNKACYIEVTPPTQEGQTRHILAVRRSDEAESILTFFTVRINEHEVEDIMVFQEITNEQLDTNIQTVIKHTPGNDDSPSLLHSSRLGESLSKVKIDETKKVLSELNGIINKAATQPVHDVVRRSITEETERIKANVRGKGRIRALGAAVVHFPEFYRQQRAAA